jgi:hypothetical protein
MAAISGPDASTKNLFAAALRACHDPTQEGYAAPGVARASREHTNACRKYHLSTLKFADTARLARVQRCIVWGEAASKIGR